MRQVQAATGVLPRLGARRRRGDDAGRDVRSVNRLKDWCFIARGAAGIAIAWMFGARNRDSDRMRQAGEHRARRTQLFDEVRDDVEKAEHQEAAGVIFLLVAGALPSAHAKQDAVEIRAGEPATFDGILVTVGEYAELVSRIENLEASNATLREAIAKAQLGDHECDVETRLLNEEIRACRGSSLEKTLKAAAWLVGGYLVGRNSAPRQVLTNPVPR